jgi:PKD repeat protein
MFRIATVLISVSLLASFAIGCSTSSPKAAFSATPRTGHPPLEVQFTDESTGEIETWEWDFDNDGTVDSTEQDPQFTYDHIGNYTVSLTVRGPAGSDTLTKTAYVKVQPCPHFADFIVEPIPGNCKVQGKGLSCTGTTTVKFNDKSTGNIIAWAWDFQSDGVIDSTEQNPSYTYRHDGVYSVTLTITTPTCEDTITRYDYISITGCKT